MKKEEEDNNFRFSRNFSELKCLHRNYSQLCSNCATVFHSLSFSIPLINQILA